MAQEAKRGCGFRKVGGIYLVSGGLWVECDRLPLPIGHCPVCGEGLKFPRSPREINPRELFGLHSPCTDFAGGENCHVCRPNSEVAYLLGVGEAFYKTPQMFMAEAVELGVSKRIAAIPKHLVVGKTWVYLVHKRGIITHEPCPHGCNPDVPQNCPKCHGSGTVEVPQMAIFSAFVPQRVEMPIWESQLTEEKRTELEKRGITPVPFKDGDPDHA